MKRDKSEFWMFSIFAIVGLGLIIGAIIATISHVKFMKSAEPVSAKIERIESRRGSKGKVYHDVYVSYVYEGQDYVDVPLNYYSSGMHKGQDIELICDSNNPYKVRSKGADLVLQIVLFAMGGVFFMVGFIPMTMLMGKEKTRTYLLQNGRALNATVERIDQNYSYSVNHKHPYVIYCTYQDPYGDVTYRFKSGNVWQNPSQYFPVGSEITVMVDPNDYSKHYVKVEEVRGGSRIVDFT